MTGRWKPPHPTLEHLRRRAETSSTQAPPDSMDLSELTPAEMQALLHELDVHRIELEMQNEDLLNTQVELETARDSYSELFDGAPVGYLLLDSRDRILRANHSVAELLGVRREALPGRRLHEFVARSDQDTLFTHLRHRFRAPGSGRCELEMRRADGSGFFARVESISRNRGAAQPFQCLTVLVDITESRMAETQLRHQLHLTEAIANCAAESIFVTDTDGRITLANPEAEQLFGFARDQLMGHALYPLLRCRYPDGRPFPGPWDDTAASPCGDDGTPRRQEAVFHHRDGTSLTVVCSSAPLTSDGETGGSVLVIHDITERKRMEAALRETDRRKDEFLAMLAHELRNPLTPIRNAAEILGLPGLDASRVTWAQQIITRQVTHLSRLVEDLLDVSRIARGKIRLREVPFDIAEVVDQAVEATRPIMEARGHRLNVSMPQGRVALKGDPVRLVQVLLNVLDNAAKFSPEEGEVNLETSVEEDELVIRVRDRGVGIPHELLPRVFDLFVQGADTRAHGRSGLGMGLSLVQQLVDLHGGQVRADSAGSGHGTTITIRLPRGRDADASSSAPQTITGNAGPLKVLVVDDEHDIADSTTLILRQRGHQVRVCYGGEDALVLAADFLPDVALLDIGMKQLDGYSTAQALRLLPGCAGIRLIALTGFGDAQARQRSREAGFDVHLVKPVEAEILLEKVATTGSGKQGE